MRLAFALGSFLFIAWCSPVYFPATASDDAVLTPEGSSTSAEDFPSLDVLQKAKPGVKSKPLPPKPDALPTYEVAAAEGLAVALAGQPVR